MSDLPQPTPRTKEVIDAYFLEHRAKVIDVAAFLDRIDRADGDCDDLRMNALIGAIAMLHDGEGDRVRRIQMHLSDQTTPPAAAATIQGAHGAPPVDAGT